MSNPVLELDQIYSSGSASLSNRWGFCNFLDKAVFAQSAVAPQYWPGFWNTRLLPGLTPGTTWDGVIAFQGHLIGFQGSTMTWSDLNDFTNFIPVASTIQDVALTLANNFTQLAPGVNTGWVFFNESIAGMVPDMFVRLEYPPYYNFYTVEKVSLINGVSGTTAAYDQLIPSGTTRLIYTASPYPVLWATETTTPGTISANAGSAGFLQVQDSGQPLQIIDQSPSNSIIGVITTGFVAPAIGSNVTIAMNENPGWAIGDYISIGGDGTNDAASLNLDVYQVAEISGISITLTRLGIGTSQQFGYPASTYAVTQPYVTLQNNNPTDAYIPANSNLVEAYALILNLENLTGAAPVGTVFVGGSSVLSLNAGEAGQLVNAGDKINGPIWSMATSGLYAVIMKERSFQSIQYVGLPGIFNIWPEFTDEGLLGRNTWCKVGENTIYFWGHRAFFQFSSGSGDPTPIGQKHFVQVLSEIDLSRVSEACMYHKEDRREVWFVYPVSPTTDYPAGPSRVFIYNYEQGSVSIDDYSTAGASPSTYPITAVGAIPVYITDLQWDEVVGAWNYQLMAWSELTSGRQFLTLMALYPSAAPQLFAHGSVYDRNGTAIYSAWETVAHDCGDEQAYKYLDLLQFSLAVRNKMIAGRPFRLYVQAGVQENFDGDVIWSTPQWVDSSGNANYVTKLNFKMSGRFIRFRFYSNQADCQWRVATYTLSGRLGNTY